jgi:hypothetical protein
MPRGPKAEKRPADVNARAAIITKIATGEIDDAEMQATDVCGVPRFATTKLTHDHHRLKG